jgi:putative membrane protein
MGILVDTNGWIVPFPVLLGCLLAEILYFRGWWRLIDGTRAEASAARASGSHARKRMAGRMERTDRTADIIKGSSQRRSYRWNDWHWRSVFFISAVLALLLAISLPIDILAGRLFWVHMVQHLILLVVVPPLLVASAPLLPWWLGLPRWGRKAMKLVVPLQIRRGFFLAGHWLLRRSVIACVLLVIGVWVWHWPPLYDLALRDSAIHDWCEHTTFLLVSTLFWAQIIPSPPFRPAHGYLGRIGCVAVGIAQNFILAVLIGFAPAPLYAPYAHLLTGPGAFSPLQDQQFGAGIMWTFGDLPFGVAFSLLVQRWLATHTDEAELVMQPR